jgi:hypothetical protein
MMFWWKLMAYPQGLGFSLDGSSTGHADHSNGGECKFFHL